VLPVEHHGHGTTDATDPIHICYKEGYFVMSVVT
jgi:hypothetical protein